MRPALRQILPEPQTWQWKSATTLVAIGLAVAANFLGPTLLLRHSLVLGSVVYWVSLGVVGPNWASAVLLANFGSLWWMWGEPFSGGILLLESVWVGAAWRRRRNPLVADIVFWTIVGLPASWFTFSQLLHLPHPSFIIALVLQPLNGLTALWFAFIASEFVHRRSILGTLAQAQSVSHVLLTRYMAFGTIPLMFAALFVARSIETETVQQSRNHIRQVGIGTAEALRRFLDHSVTIVEHNALRKMTPESMSSDHLNGELAKLHSADPRFVSMLATDADGYVIAAAPEAARTVAEQRIYVGDREYFKRPRDTRAPYVSPPFRGRSFGSELIVAVSAPCQTVTGEWLGIIEASVAVATVKQTIAQTADAKDWKILLTDAQNVVIEAQGFADQPLTRISHPRLLQHLRRADGEPETIVMGDAGHRETMLSVTVPVPGYEWNVTVQRPMTKVLKPIIAAYSWTIAIGAATAGFAWLFVSWSIRGLLSALHRTLEYSRGRSPEVLEGINPASVPHELAELIMNLRKLSARAEGERRKREEILANLERLVQERTRELEEALTLAKSAEKAKDAFLATVSHELRTPLTSLVTGVRLLKLDGSYSVVANRTLDTMERSSQVLMDVISDVLEFSRIQSGALGLEPHRFKPAELLREVETIMRPRLDLKAVAFIAHCEYGREFEFFSDSRRLRQILLNLVGNAAKFTKSGHILVRTWKAGETKLYFSVADTGPGIPAEELNAIFEPFVQVRTESAPSIAGTGLGLTICKRLTELMGGEISVENVSDGGACFTFYISSEST